MAGMMDNIKDKMGDMSEEMKQRMHMLKSKEQDGSINDSERTELQQLRDRTAGHGGL